MSAWKTQIARGLRADVLVSLGSVAGALGVASCCALPLALAGLGVGSAWLVGFGALAAYQPILLALTMTFLGAGFFLVYRRASACAPGDSCSATRDGRAPKIALWSAVALTLAGLVAG